MSPTVISTIRLTIRIAVVLPHPDGPTRTQISPAGTSSVELRPPAPRRRDRPSSPPGRRPRAPRHPPCWLVSAATSRDRIPAAPGRRLSLLSMAPTMEAAHPRGLSSARGGPPPRTNSASPSRRTAARSRRIVAANTLTLFNAIIGVFFILILSLGLLADAIFGFIAALNSYIGIRQELKAKETLDQLALLVAPRAQVDPRRRPGRAARRRGRAGRRGPHRAGRPAGRRRRGDPVARPDDRRVDADRRVRRDPQAGTRSRALGLVLPQRAPATTRWTRCARRATPRRSPARRGRSATRPRPSRRRSTG